MLRRSGRISGTAEAQRKGRAQAQPTPWSCSLCTGSSLGCPVVGTRITEFQAGLPWSSRATALRQSGCSTFHPVPSLKLSVHSFFLHFSHSPQGKAAHSSQQHPSGAASPRKSKRDLTNSWGTSPRSLDLHFTKDGQTKKNCWTFEESLWPKSGHRWTRKASSHRKKNIRKKT